MIIILIENYTECGERERERKAEKHCKWLFIEKTFVSQKKDFILDFIFFPNDWQQKK